MPSVNHMQHELHAAQDENSELRRQVQLLQRRLSISTDQMDRHATLLDQVRDEASALRRATNNTQERASAVQSAIDTMARQLRNHR